MSYREVECCFPCKDFDYQIPIYTHIFNVHLLKFINKKKYSKCVTGCLKNIFEISSGSIRYVRCCCLSNLLIFYKQLYNLNMY